MKTALMILLSLPTLAVASTLKSLQDHLDFQLGMQTMQTYCPAQAKTDVPKELSLLDTAKCGLEPADIVNTAVEGLPLESLLESLGLAYEFTKVKGPTSCNATAKIIQEILKKARDKSKSACFRLGHTLCDEPTVEFTLTSDSYCVLTAKSQPSNGSKMPNIEKMLAAKKMLQEALSLYHYFPCDTAKIKQLVAEALTLVQSTDLFEDPQDPINSYRLCQFLEKRKP